MNFFQKTAIWWYRTFDATGILFDIISKSSKAMRYFIYFIFPISLYFVMSFLGSLVDLQHSNLFLEYPVVVSLIILFGKASLILAPLFAALIFSYESILNLNVQAIIKEKKEQEQYKKTHKLQWWRLRNMGQFKRIFVYLFFYFIIVNMAQIFALGAVSQSLNVNINEVKQAFQTLITWITIFYIAIVMLLDYLASQKRKKR